MFPTRQHQLGVATAILAAMNAGAQELEFSISPSPVGAGARAAGMADAFVAVADDATAASWNPAGLVQLERPELSLVSAFNAVSEEFHTGSDPEFEDSPRESELSLNFASLVYPIPHSYGGRNITLGATYQQKYSFDRSFDSRLNATQIVFGDVIDTNRSIDFEQQGGLGLYSLSAAMDLTHDLAIGLSANFWRSSPLAENGWTQQTRVGTDLIQNGVFQGSSSFVTLDEYANVRGENLTLGMLWNPTQRLTLGLRYDTPLHADADFSRNSLDDGVPLAPVHENRELHIPGTIAAGLSIRTSDRFTVSADLSTTDWNDFYIEQADGSKFSLVDGHDLDDPVQKVDFDRTYTIRIGGEYVFIPKALEEDLPRLWTLRGGLFLDQEPAADRAGPNTNTPGTGNPDNFYGAALGAGVLLHNRINLDAAYQIRYGNNVNSDYIRGIQGFNEDFVQHRVLVSMILYF